jgi:hypothetical protein
LSLFKILTYRTFEPTEISGLQVWLDNDTLGADGSAVSSWADSSGNGFNFTQSTAAYQPDIFVDGSRKTVRMTADSVLICNNGLAMLKNVAGATVYTVYRPDVSTNPLLSISDGAISFDDARVGQSNLSSRYNSAMTILDGGTTNNVISTTVLDSSNYIIHGTFADFANNDLYQYLNSELDGSSVQAGGSNTSNTNSAAIFLGGSAQVPHVALVPSSTLVPQATVFASVKYLEILIFNRVLTALEKYNVENYLSIKHGITLA